ENITSIISSISLKPKNVATQEYQQGIIQVSSFLTKWMEMQYFRTIPFKIKFNWLLKPQLEPNGFSKNLPISSFGNNGQSGHLTQQAGRRPIDQTYQKEQKYSAVKAHQQVQTQTISWIEAPLQKIRKNQQHIKHYNLHGIEPNVPTKVGVPNNHKVKGQEHQKPIEGKALKHPYSWYQRLDKSLNGSELSDNVFSVLYAIKEGVEVT
ncbi:hypothetical protein F2P56_005571, partial [Juglans regia]